jgi:hypothetical protein
MKECPLAHDLRYKVERQGGSFSFAYHEGYLELICYKPGEICLRSEMCSSKAYSYMLIEDSINAKQMLRVSEYRIKTAEEPPDDPGKKRRIGYSAIDDRKMMEYVKTNPGSAKSLGYWEIAVKKGLLTNHSANSLKIHWSQVVKKNPIRPFKPTIHKRKSFEFLNEEIPTTPGSVASHREFFKFEQDKRRKPSRVVEEHKNQTDRVGLSEPVTIESSADKSMGVKDDKEIKAENPTMLERFKELVDECRGLGNQPLLDERTVLERLLHFKGSSLQVKSFYEAQSKR